MFRTKYIRALILAAAAVAAACTADPADPVNPEPDYEAEPASLTIDFSIADLGIDVETRADADTGGSSDTGGSTEPSTPTFALSSALPEGVVKYLNPDKIWTAPESDAEKDYYNEARSINGSVMTCLTVILIHRHSNRIVGMRRIPDPDCPSKHGEVDLNNTILVKKEDGSFARGELLYDASGNIRAVVGTHARVTFEYENPGHVVTQEMVGDNTANQQYIGKSAERLVRGEYTILAIANYDHNVTTSSTGNGNETLNVDKTLEDISDLFHQPQHMAEGIYPFAPVPDRPDLPHYSFLYNLRFLMNRTLASTGDGDYDVIEITGTDGQQIKPYIRPAVHQTLTAASEFYLTAGDNHMAMELLRISSRTRVEVKNYIPKLDGIDEDKLKLQVNSLSFSDNYTQSTNYLFRRNKDDRDYSELATTTGRYTDVYYTDHDGKGAPMVGYTGIQHPGSDPTYGAIVPFVAEGNYVMPNKKKCIFDALMYESNVKYKDVDEPADLDSLTYTIDVSYPGITNYQTTDKNKLAPGYSLTSDSRYEYLIKDVNRYITSTSSAEKVYESIKEKGDEIGDYIDEIKRDLNNENIIGGCYFLIQGVGTGKFLFEKEDGTLYAEETNPMILDAEAIKSYLWTFEGLEKNTANNNYYCYLTNLRSGKHMPTIPQCVAPTEAEHMKSTDDNSSQKYKLEVSDWDGYSHTGDFNVTFSNHFDQSCSHGVKDSYLSIWANGTYLSGWHEADPGCQYRLYPISLLPVLEGTPHIKKEVKLTTFSDETAFVEEVREIQRNDFVRILVEVSYNPENCEFEFKAMPWVKKSGSVSFH